MNREPNFALHLIFILDQQTANPTFALHDSLLLSGCIIGVLSCSDTTKRGDNTLSYIVIFIYLFLVFILLHI